MVRASWKLVPFAWKSGTRSPVGEGLADGDGDGEAETGGLDVTVTDGLGGETEVDPPVLVSVHPMAAPMAASATNPATSANTCPTDVGGLTRVTSDVEVGVGFTP
jgi:hypothetical protein